MTTLFTNDFSTQWANDLVEGTTYLALTKSIDAGRLRVYGSASVVNSKGRAVLEDLYPARADQEVLIQTNYGQSAQGYLGLRTNGPGLQSSGTLTYNTPDTAGADGIWIGLNNNSIQVIVGGVPTSIGTLPTIPNASTNTNSWVRFRVEGNTVYFKTWSSTGTEPGTWNATYDISAYTIPDGHVSLWVRRTSTSTAPNWFFDNMTVESIPAFQEVTYSATPMTADATAPDATRITGTGVTVNATAMTATGSNPSATVVTGTGYRHFATPMTATGSTPTAVASAIRNPTYVATPITAAAQMPSATVSTTQNADVQATPMTATATSPNASVKLSGSSVIEDDYSFDQFGSPNTSDILYLNGLSTSGGGAISRIVLKYTGPEFATVVDSAILTLGTRATGAGTMSSATVYPILNDWTERPTSKESFTLGTPVSVPLNAGDNSLETLDLTNLFDEGQVYGFLIEGDESQEYKYFQSNEGTLAPAINVQYHYEIGNVVVSAEPMTATAEMLDAEVSLVTDVNILAEPFEATATMPVAYGFADKDVEIPVEPMEAFAEMPGGEFSLPATVTAEPMTAEGMSPDATTSTTIGVTVMASPMKGAARFVTIEQVNDTLIEGEAVDDNYFNRVKANNPSYWVRMLAPTSPLNNYVTQQPLLDVRGLVTLNQLDGPDGRPSIHFTGGGYLEQREPSGTNQDENVPYRSTNWAGDNPHTLEFAIRTTKPNQFIMIGSDSLIDERGVVSDANVASEINMVNGRVQFKHYRSYVPTGTRDVAVDETVLGTGTRIINDGEWHTIVVRHAKSPVRDEYGFEIWIDGTLEFRRLLNAGWTAGMPDYIGGRPNYISGVTVPNLANSRQFEGDMAEIVFYPMLNLSKDDIERNRYAFMGWTPIEADPFEADAEMTDATGRGNQKRALYLYWSGQDEVFGGIPAPSLGANTDFTSFDPMPGLAADSYSASLAPRLNEETGEFFGYKVFTKSITRNYTPFGIISYRDPITDEQSLIDLTRDVNLADYDIIMFKDWPDESYERDWYEANYPGQMERVLNQLREANDAGTGLYVTNPRLAIDLGIIDRVEFTNPLTEHKFIGGQGRAEGAYDYGSAVKFPWDIVSSDGLTGNAFATGIGQPMNTNPSYLAQKAYFYYDNNRNNKFRVVAKIPGLTDLPSYMLQDAVFHIDADPYGWEGVAYKYLHRENGLEIGDEYIFNGSPAVDPRFMSTTELRYLRGNGQWATPPGHVKAGTVVTTYGSKHFVGTGETNNSYQDYATTIVLETGTMLAGRPTGGRIFVNFTETPSGGLDVPVQVLPGSQDALDNPLGLGPDDSLDANAPVFVINGTAEQKALTEEALARCTFPFERLQSRIKARYGNPTTPIVWTDIDPGEESGGLGVFHRDTGVIEIDQGAINTWAGLNGRDPEDLAMSTIVHELGHMIDYVYLQPYQRVNIWNVFHEDWNVWHEDQGPQMEGYRLPVGYPLDMTTTNIHEGEGWSGGSYRYEKLAEAFAQAFVQAYSDIPVDVFAYVRRNQAQQIIDGHPAPESIGPKIRAAIEVGQGAYLFNQGQVESGWPAGYNEETPAQREWEYSWTRTSLTFSAAALKTRTVNVTLPDGSIQSIVQGSTLATRGDLPLSMVRSGQLFPVISKPRLEMTARGAYWLADETKPEVGDVVVRTTAMTANGTSPSATAIAQRSNAVLAQPMTATAQMPESQQAKSGNALVLASPMTADATMSQGRDRVIRAEAMTATATMPDAVYKFSGDVITLRLPRPAKITLRIKEAV